MTQAAYDNSAGRLYTILSEGRTKKGNVRAGEIWAEILQVPKANTGELLRVLALLISSYAEMKAQVRSLDAVDHTLLSEHFPTIDRAFSIVNLEAPWDQVKQHLTEAVLYSLKVCAFELARNGRNAKLSEAELKRLQTEIESLVERIVKGHLDQKFKKWAVYQLNQIRSAIVDYRLTGVDGLIATTERTLGSLAARPEAISNLKGTEEGREVWEVVRSVHNMAASAVNAAEVLHYTLRSLPELAGNGNPALLFINPADDQNSNESD